MKLKEIILDFTSLLDVIMIILFWFVISYKAQAQEQIAEAQQSASKAISSAEMQIQEAEKLSQQAKDQLDALAEVSERQASNLEAMLEFGDAENITIYLCMEEEGWRLDVYKGALLLDSIPDAEEKQIGLRLNGMLTDAGYKLTDTVFCVFSYDSSEPGTRAAYQSVIRELGYVKLGNKHFFCSEVDSANQKG